MNFWNKIKNLQLSDKNSISLKEKLQNELNLTDDDALTKITCLSALMAKVAYSDFIVHEGEQKQIEKSLKEWTDLEQKEVEIIANFSISEIKNLAGLEDHLYISELNRLMSEDERYQVLLALFSIAASDGSVEVNESEEIRFLANALKLSHKHFTSAQSTVYDKLKVLKK